MKVVFTGECFLRRCQRAVPVLFSPPALRVRLEEAETAPRSVLAEHLQQPSVSVAPLCAHVRLLTAPEGAAVRAPPSARRGGPAAGARLHLGHQQAERISRRSNQLPTSEAEEDTAVRRGRVPTRDVHGYSRVVLQPHQADAVHGQDPVARSQLLAPSRRRTRNQRLDVHAAHPQLGFLGGDDGDASDEGQGQLQEAEALTIPSTSARPSP